MHFSLCSIHNLTKSAIEEFYAERQIESEYESE
jgi:hypothetical protein